MLEGRVDEEAKKLSSQDELWYVPVDLDLNISYGHIKQYRQSNGVYTEPLWITEIRYDRRLNVCWKRFVCCKELMHVFDSADERTNTPEKFRQLLSELENPPPAEKSSEMYKSESKAMWMALAILCPGTVYNARKPVWEGEKFSNYAIALELRIPEHYVDALLSDTFAGMLEALENACKE